MEPKNYIELQDEHGNITHTINDQPVVIVAFKLGITLQIVSPMAFKMRWPTVKAAGWKEVDHEAGAISEEEWKRLVEL